MPLKEYSVIGKEGKTTLQALCRTVDELPYNTGQVIVIDSANC